ncbi:hypothetical protein BBJ28_00005345 [Nothophytophthora sp. Chile5]|nr:hypothetical protein BBJ28_00005345 [Nothophytophthora sp. Chile5]
MSGVHYLKEGWLKKRSREGKLVPNWRRRYFRLTRSELLYYDTPQSMIERRRYELTLASEVLQTNDQGYPPLCFVLKSAPDQPNFYMQAENETEKSEWVAAIYNAYRRTPGMGQLVDAPVVHPVIPAKSIGATPMQPPPAPAAPAPRILLNMVLEEARNLHASNFIGKSDPYCVVKLVGTDGQIIDAEEKRTECITATLNPVWKAPFTVGRVVDLSSVKAIQFELWDHDNFKKHDSLGTVRVPFAKFRMSPASTGQSEPVDDWFRVEPPKKITRSSSPRRNDNRDKEHVVQDYGELRVKMSICGPNLVDFFQSAHFVPTSSVATASIEHTDNRLEVSVLGAKSLISADFNNSSDPYCELSLLDEHGQPIRGENSTTATQYRTRNPVWADEHHVFGMICPIEQAATLKVRVMDHDNNNRNDPLGFVLIGLDQLSAHKWTEWHALQPEEGMAIQENLGEIQLTIWLVGERRGERARRLKIDKEVTMKAHEQSVEQLELENAQLQLHDAACRLDGARIPCAVDEYQTRDPRFYGINGCIHHLNTQIPRAHREEAAADENLLTRAGLAGQALLEVTVVSTVDLKKKDPMTAPSPYAVIDVDPAVCIEECKRTSAPLSPQKSKRIAAESRNTLFSKRDQAEVSSHRPKLAKNEVRSEKALELGPDRPVLKVEVLTGHELSPADSNGYSDPYCTLSIIDRVTGKPVESEKKRTSVVSKTLNPVWANECFVFGNNVPLSDASSLLIHVKDHNNFGRSTPLGRVQISLYDLCRASADTTSISSQAMEKRYPLTPEPWMKNHATALGELCIKTEVVGDATVLAEMMQRTPNHSPEKALSFSSSFSSEGNMQSESGLDVRSSKIEYTTDAEFEDEKTETLVHGIPIRTSTVVGSKAAWRKEKFSLSLSYPGMFSNTKHANIEDYTLHLRIHSARGLLIPTANGSGGSSRPTINTYFTVIPVLGDGRVEDRERKQSLTVYGTSSPSWPDQEFVFGKARDISSISYLSLHVYARDLQDDGKKPVSALLSAQERQQNVRLRRFQLHKLAPSGEVEDDGFEMLQFDQRVLAFRRCDDGGRFYPARVQQYIPFPHDEYDVRFEGSIETINDLWELFSFDVKGKIQAVRPNGRVDVSVEGELPASEKAASRGSGYAMNTLVSQLTPVNAFTKEVEMTMARVFVMEQEEQTRWRRMQHKFSGLAISILSASNLSKLVTRPGCLITLLGNPKKASKSMGFTAKGELMVVSSGDAKTLMEFAVPHGNEPQERNENHLFQQKPLVLGEVELMLRNETNTESTREVELVNAQVLAHVSSLLIRVVEQGSDSEPCARHKTIGFVRIDLAVLRMGEQDLELKIIPPEESKVPYFKSAGSLFLHISCSNATKSQQEVGLAAQSGTATEADLPLSICGLSLWYDRQLVLDAQTSSTTAYSRKVTHIQRRQMLRSSLRPTENAQIDDFHVVLVIIMKRIVSILRELRQFEDFEALNAEDMLKCRQVHRVNADPKSEWLGRTMNELSLETRKDIVVQLEMELLNLAAVDAPRVYPAPDASREEWVRLRTVRQKALQENSGFFMRDQTSVLTLSPPCSFTGEAMISWILRAPPVLWKDQWTKYCHDTEVLASCRLNWHSPALEVDSNAIQAPKTRAFALQWLSALCAAGFVETAISTASLTDLSKKHTLVEDKTDRFYRLREVERWMAKLPQEKSLFPLNLVQEVDCYHASVSSSSKSTATETEEKASEHECLKRTYAKKLTSYCDGFLGLQTVLSNLLLSPEVQKNSLLLPVAEKTQQLVDENVLWAWKYCLFIPAHRCLYLYERETSAAPMALLDMASAACRAAYNFSYDIKGGWMDIVNATMYVKQSRSQAFVPIDDELRDKMMKIRENGDKVLEFKTRETQKWIQAFARAGVSIDMRPGQTVLMKRLNPKVLQRLCIHYVTEFNQDDLEGSFHRVLNRFFGHDKSSSHQEHEKKMHNLRAQVRGEMKKAGAVGETVMAYYGKGMKLNPKSMFPGNFTKESLYSGRISRIRTPYPDPKHRLATQYDRKNKDEVPKALDELLTQYKVTDMASWLNLPETLRDLFLLYDVEYRHANERITEEGLMREHLRTADGDLDPKKVREKCTDLNLLFKPTDLEDCVTRMAVYHNQRKPLGLLKIPIKMVSPHRIVDTWYPLAPASDMVQKVQLGRMRVELRLVREKHVKRSKKTPALLEEVKSVTLKQQVLTKKNSTSKLIKSKFTKRSGSAAFAVGREPSFVKISILEGRKLLIADFKTSDPFVRLVLLDKDLKKEYDTRLKTDIKSKTLNPKWENQQFLLGKAENTMLSSRKAVLLRVMDHDALSENDPLGCVRLEFQRDNMGYIIGLVLVRADPKGNPVTEQLLLDEHNRVEVEAMLLPNVGQSALMAKGNAPETDGKLGTLRFAVEIVRNENYVDPAAITSSAEMAGLVKHLETGFSAEVAIKSARPVKKGAASDVAGSTTFDWRQYTCVFQPHGEGGLRIQYDATTEDLGPSNSHKLADLLRLAEPLVASETANASGAPEAASVSVATAFKVLGRTFNLSKVAYFDVRLASDSLGKVFEGKLGDSGDIFKNPEHCASFRDKEIILKDRDGGELEVCLTVDLNLIGILRADRVRRVLADTFRLVGLTFDPRTMHQNNGRFDPSQLQNDVQAFLWDTCRANVFPGRNVGEELLAQVRRMSQASKLHWKITPQLLSYVFEVVFSGGEKDRLTFANAVALDAILIRWSQVLEHVSEAKSQLIGHLDGKKTPRLIEVLFTECDWTGFDWETGSLETGATKESSASKTAYSKQENGHEAQGPLRIGDRVNALLPFLKHAGVTVDVQLPNGKFVAATIVKECGNDRYEVRVCAGSKGPDEGDSSSGRNFLPVSVGETIFVYPHHFEESAAPSDSSGRHGYALRQGRLGKVEQFDEKLHGEARYLVVYCDSLEPHQEWRTRASMNATFSRVAGDELRLELQKEDYVRVTAVSEKTTASTPSDSISTGISGDKADGSASNTGLARSGKIIQSHGNARYDIAYVDGQSPSIEPFVARDRLLPVTDRALYGGVVTNVHLAAAGSTPASPMSTVKYDVLLVIGERVERLPRTQLRLHDEHLAADTALLGAVFTSRLRVQDHEKQAAVAAKRLEELWWGNDRIVKVYATLPSKVKSIQIRDATTNKLLPTKLVERDETRPRFLNQYHGFIAGDKLSKTEETKLRELYEVACIRRMHGSNGGATAKDVESFTKETCFCLLLAPSPLVQIHGTLAVSPSAGSQSLFTTLLALAQKKPSAFVRLFQRLLRGECSVNLPLDRKERIASMQSVDVCFDRQPMRNVELNMLNSTYSGQLMGEKDVTVRVPFSQVSIDVKFQLSVPHNDRGSLADAVDVACQDAEQILAHLSALNTLDMENGATFSSMNMESAEKAQWEFKASDDKATTPSRTSLCVRLLNRKAEKGSKPDVSLELEPLDDICLSVLDIGDRTHEIRFPMAKVLVEAQVRRHLSPFVAAKVTGGPHSLSEKHAHLEQVNKRARRDSQKLTAPTLLLKTNKPQAGEAATQCYDLKFLDGKDLGQEIEVSKSDIRFDCLHVQVLEVSQLRLEETMGTENLQVQVLLISSDFQAQIASDKLLTTPFEVELSTSGEITKDMKGKKYPENSTFILNYGKDTTKWAADASKRAEVVFQYPSIDLKRVTGMKLNLLDGKHKTQLGSATIPLSQIASDASSTQVDSFSVYRKVHGRQRVVGKISLVVKRLQSFRAKAQGDGENYEDDLVYAKRLDSDKDPWGISPVELLSMTLEQHEDKFTRGLLASGPAVLGGGKILLQDSIQQELQLQKIVNVKMISDSMMMIYSLKASSSTSTTAMATATTQYQSGGYTELLPVLTLDQLMQSTKTFVEDAALELGLSRYATNRRLPWSSDPVVKASDNKHGNALVAVDASVATSTHRLRRKVLKLHHMYLQHLIPTLQKLHALDAMGYHINVAAGEQLLTFFEEEVDGLELEDQEVLNRVYQRLRLVKLAQVLEDIMNTTVRVKLMDEGRGTDDGLLGIACIPLVDLLDQQQHDDMYQLLWLPNTIQRGFRVGTNAIGSQIKQNKEANLGKVRLRLQLKYSESVFLAQATNVYKTLKAQYIAQHEAARRRINIAVVPAQRRKWMTIKGYLEELTKQASGKLHWERTPVLLNLVWDIFVSHESSLSPSRRVKKEETTVEQEHLQSIAHSADSYRDAVVLVHQRWANLQPQLEELMTIQASKQIHAKRTRKLLEKIEQEVEGLDVGLSTAWLQVKHKWKALLDALEELVAMQERNKLHLGRAPQLLKLIEQRCSKGLSRRHAEAVSNVQFRWMAITQPNGPLCELRLMDKNGLHWRRTHELVLLLNEQCEGFAEVDAKALEMVQNRWQQVQEWLDDVVRMQQQHAIDCEQTPIILQKMHILERTRARRSRENRKSSDKLSQPAGVAPASPKTKAGPGSRPRSLSNQSSSSHLSIDGSASGSTEAGAEDSGQLEGIAEWYAIEEARYELERLPYHRITTDAERDSYRLASREDKATRLLITQEDMAFSAANVRLALEDRGVIPKTSSFDPTAGANKRGSGNTGVWASPSRSTPESSAQTMVLPKELLEEINDLERSLENRHDDGHQSHTVANPERVAELYLTIESLGKTDLLWKVDHAVSRNRELAVPESFKVLLQEMKLRQIPTTELENLRDSLLLVLQKEALTNMGLNVPPAAIKETVVVLMHQHQVKEVALPQDTKSIQSLGQERGMDRKGEPVLLRGIRIGTQSTGVTSAVRTALTSLSSSSGNAKTLSLPDSINTGLGIIDTHVELLRKSLLFEALRKRNSLVRTFPGESHVLDGETGDEHDDFAAESTEVDLSGDYLTLVERFQQLLVHESYTKRLADYAALDRCMRALLSVDRDAIVTKEDIAEALHTMNNSRIGANYRLPVEAFTREELLEAAQAGRIRTPSEEILTRCPRGRNARAMAHYAAVSYAANVFQEATSFRSRVDPTTQLLQDAFPFEERSSLDGAAVPKDRSHLTLRQSIVDWLLGAEASVTRVQRQLSAGHRQRLQWASAAFTLRNRWLQRGLGWCDSALGEGVGVKMLLQRLLLFEEANKMHMVQTEALLKELRDKCEKLLPREHAAQEKLEERYQTNLELLEKLVEAANRCLNNRKLHSEDTPVLLHAVEQACVVPNGLSAHHSEAYHVVTSHWLPHRQRLEELVKMHKEGTFSITRTPELLGQMNFHTEGQAGSEELSEVKVTAAAQTVKPELQQSFVDRKLDEVRRGQRKEPSSLHLDLNLSEDFTGQTVDEGEWKTLSTSKRVVQPMSPREKQTSWKLVKNAVAANAAFAATSPSRGEQFKVELAHKDAAQEGAHRRKSSLGDELKEFLRSPSKWLTMGADETQQVERQRSEFLFPLVLSREGPNSTAPGSSN